MTLRLMIRRLLLCGQSPLYFWEIIEEAATTNTARRGCSDLARGIALESQGDDEGYRARRFGCLYFQRPLENGIFRRRSHLASRLSRKRFSSKKDSIYGQATSLGTMACRVGSPTLS